MQISFIAGPVVGGIIGYITNSLAIRMLFRPHKALYIGSFHIPFTPGLIPKEKGRIAKSLGDVISEELLNSEVFYKTLTSDRMIGFIENAYDDFFDKCLKSQSTLREKLYKYSDKDLMDGIITDANYEISALVSSKLSNFNLGEEISKQVLINMKEKHKQGFSLKSAFANIVDDNIIYAISEKLGKVINNAVSDNSEQIVSGFLENETDKFLDVKICDFAEKYIDKREDIKKAFCTGYKKIIKKDIPRILEAVNISAIVEERISSYNIKDLEKLLRSVMQKELSAIIWLGAVLGFVLGFINSFIRF